MKGKFIVLEGPDRCGKSTQAKLLYNYLISRGYEAVLTREPGGTPTAERIRQMVLEPGVDVRPMAELFLYEASRAQHTQEKSCPRWKRERWSFANATPCLPVLIRGMGAV